MNQDLEKNFKSEWISRMREIIPDSEWNKFLKSCLQPLPKTIRIKKNFQAPNIWHLSPAAEIPEAFFLQTDQNVPFAKTLPYFCGQIYPMSLSSFLPVHVLHPRPFEKIVDLCSSPGSKTTFMTDRMENTGALIANEFDGKRIKALEENIRRMGVMNTIIIQIDGSLMAQYFSEEMDKVLVDAPCSSDGFGRRDPTFYTKIWSERNIPSLVKLQKKLITAGFQILRAGGEMVYSTCTGNPEENEGVVESLLDQFPEAEIMPIDLKNIPCREGVGAFLGHKFSPQVVHHVRRLFPHLQTKSWDSEFFFVAKIKKIKSEGRDIPHLQNESPFTILKKNRYAEIVALFRKHFGMPNEIWKNFSFLEKENEIFVLSKDAVALTARIPFKKIGMPLWHREKGVSTEFAIHFGKYATQNIWKLSSAEKERFLFGYDLELPKNKEWHHGDEIIVQFENDSLGYGKVVNGKLKNKLETRLAVR